MLRCFAAIYKIFNLTTCLLFSFVYYFHLVCKGHIYSSHTFLGNHGHFSEQNTVLQPNKDKVFILMIQMYKVFNKAAVRT